jgi:hypothetical protein
MTEPTSPPSDDSEHTHEAFELLGDAVPLTLLLDLAREVDSEDIYAEEPGSADWLKPVVD